MNHLCEPVFHSSWGGALLLLQVLLTNAYSQTIPEFIELNKNKADIVLNKSQCDRNSEIFYLDFAFNSPGGASLQQEKISRWERVNVGE